MGKECYIGGDYIETTGGDVKNYANEIYNSSSLNQFVQNAGRVISHNVNESPPLINPNIKLKRFIVHFRRPSDYDGKYGFDWLREEYIFPIKMVTNDNNGTPINAATPLCKNVNKLKQEYLTGVKNSIVPYGIKYYPAWLSIFAHTTTKEFAHGSRMHASGISLDLQFDEIDSIVSDGTEIILESKNKHLKISPGKIPISEVLATKKTSRNINGKNINFYKLNKKVTIKCEGGALNQDEEIKVFAKLKDNNTGIEEKQEVGKLMVYKNNVIPKAEIVVVNVITPGNSAQLKDDYQYLFKNQSFNQALIRAEISIDTKFDINLLPLEDADVINFKQKMSGNDSEFIKNTLGVLYDRYGKFKTVGGINGNQNKKTYLFLTSLTAGNVLGSCSIDSNRNWGNFYIVYNAGLKDGHTIMHECGHSLSLPHVFQEGARAKHTFYHGYTDNYMDYTWQAGVFRNGTLFSSGANAHKGKMYSFFKWQWDIMRGDRSLTHNY